MKIQSAVLATFLTLTCLFGLERKAHADEIFVYAVDFINNEGVHGKADGVASFRTNDIPKFDPELGELTSIEVTISMGIFGDGGAVNTNVWSGPARTSIWGMLKVRESELPDLSYSMLLEDSGQDIAYSSPWYVMSYGMQNPSDTLTTSTNLSNVIGTGDWHFTTLLEFGQDIDDRENWDLWIGGGMNVGITVKYTYTPY